jgi:hypothetical protein
MTVKDQIIEEIRQPCRDISAECGNDLRALADYMERQNAIFATQVAAWKKLEDDRSRESRNPPGKIETSTVAEEPPNF